MQSFLTDYILLDLVWKTHVLFSASILYLNSKDLIIFQINLYDLAEEIMTGNIA